jgi:hypothetical protein
VSSVEQESGKAAFRHNYPFEYACEWDELFAAAIICNSGPIG